MKTQHEERYEERLAAKEQSLSPLLTTRFLETLQEAVKVCGWSVDHIESSQFVEWCFELANKETPNTEPYDYED